MSPGFGLQRSLRGAFLIAALLATVLPRFDLRDPGPIRRFTAGATATRYGLPLDVEGYVRLTAYFRGEMPADSLIPPYCFRPLVPLAASSLPWRALTSIDLIDILCLMLTLLLLDRLLRDLGFDLRARTAGCLLFAVSFPTFYYGAIGFVDPAVLLVVTAAIAITLRGRLVTLALLLAAGALVKETTAVMGLLPWAWGWARGRSWRIAAATSAGLVVLGILVALAFRALAPFPRPEWFWPASLTTLGDNLARPRTLLTFVLTLGAPAACALVALAGGGARKNLSPDHLRFFLAGSGIVAALYAISLFSAYADGRVLWAAYPFLIPIAATLWGPARAAGERDRESGRAS